MAFGGDVMEEKQENKKETKKITLRRLDKVETTGFTGNSNS
jgi:hypothetical protein